MSFVAAQSLLQPDLSEGSPRGLTLREHTLGAAPCGCVSDHKACSREFLDLDEGPTGSAVPAEQAPGNALSSHIKESAGRAAPPRQGCDAPENATQSTLTGGAGLSGRRLRPHGHHPGAWRAAWRQDLRGGT